MSFIDLFFSLDPPAEPNSLSFCALPIDNYTNHRIGIDYEGHPVLLLNISNTGIANRPKNFRLKHLEIRNNIQCRIIERDIISYQTFSIIIFKSLDEELQELFLHFSEAVINSINEQPSQKELLELLEKFVAIFQTLSSPPIKTVQGLWAELFIIESSKDPILLLNCWHHNPEDKFDFSFGNTKLEVKSNSNTNRVHAFSSDQLNPTFDTETILIASLFTLKVAHGKSIKDLVESITTKLERNSILSEKLIRVVCHTLGSSLEESFTIKFDYDVAKHSLKLYNHEDIPKITREHIPNAVTNVKYYSDLSQIKSVDLHYISNNELFKAIYPWH